MRVIKKHLFLLIENAVTFVLIFFSIALQYTEYISIFFPNIILFFSLNCQQVGKYEILDSFTIACDLEIVTNLTEVSHICHLTYCRHILVLNGEPECAPLIKEPNSDFAMN